MKRSFSLIEVLVSVSLFFVALTFILPPMQKAAHMICHDREELQAQSAVEEAVHAFHASLFQYDPFTYDMTITVHPDQTPEVVLQAVDAEIRRLQQAPVKPDEIARAIKQARALFAYGSENITNQAFWLGYAEMFDSYHWFLNYMERLAEVTPEDVLRVAQTCLQPTRRVVGIYRPTGAEEPNP